MNKQNKKYDTGKRKNTKEEKDRKERQKVSELV